MLSEHGYGCTGDRKLSASKRRKCHRQWRGSGGVSQRIRVGLTYDRYSMETLNKAAQAIRWDLVSGLLRSGGLVDRS